MENDFIKQKKEIEKINQRIPGVSLKKIIFVR